MRLIQIPQAELQKLVTPEIFEQILQFKKELASDR